MVLVLVIMQEALDTDDEQKEVHNTMLGAVVSMIADWAVVVAVFSVLVAWLEVALSGIIQGDRIGVVDAEFSCSALALSSGFKDAVGTAELEGANVVLRHALHSSVPSMGRALSLVDAGAIVLGSGKAGACGRDCSCGAGNT
jgi:hypothetical protein